MENKRPFRIALERLRRVNVRPTRQRLALARLLFERGHRHVTAESLHEEALAADVQVSLATVYNTLHQFTSVGLLREIVVEPSRSYFDTNVSDHHHFYSEDGGDLEDIPSDHIVISRLPEPPAGKQLSRIDVVVRIRNE